MSNYFYHTSGLFISDMVQKDLNSLQILPIVGVQSIRFKNIHININI